jgi:hypothetical protein
MDDSSSITASGRYHLIMTIDGVQEEIQPGSYKGNCDPLISGEAISWNSIY